MQFKSHMKYKLIYKILFYSQHIPGFKAFFYKGKM